MAAPVDEQAKKEHIKAEMKKDSIADFLQSETLSDMILVNSLTGAQYKYLI